MSNVIKKAFDEVHAEKQLKERTVSDVTEKMRSYKTKPTVRMRKRISAAAACIIMICTGTAAYKLYFTEISAISLDINPSIEMGINRFDKIVKIEGLNESGKNIVKVLNLKYKDYDKAVDIILSSTQLNENADIVATVLSDDEDRKNKIIENLRSYSENCQRNMKCLGGDSQSVEKAHDCGLSFGKYKALLELQKYAPEFTADDIRDMSMQDIRRLIKEYSGQDSGANGVDDKKSTGSDEKDCIYTDENGGIGCGGCGSGRHSHSGNGKKYYED